MKMFRSIALGFGLLLATASYAQETNVRATVPFDFIVGNHALPAGEYTVQSIGSAGLGLSIRNYDKKAGILSVSQSCRKSNPSDKTVLVFHRVGTRYFLREIWLQGSESGRQLPQSRAEAEMALNQKVETVIVAASLAAR
jgi:hypothetical protein